eukprot:3639855-Amphidinium_carterae.1
MPRSSNAARGASHAASGHPINWSHRLLSLHACEGNCGNPDYPVVAKLQNGNAAQLDTGRDRACRHVCSMRVALRLNLEPFVFTNLLVRHESVCSPLLAGCSLVPEQQRGDLGHLAKLCINIAGSPCVDFSMRGKREGAFGVTAASHAIWLGQFVSSGSPVCIHENTPKYPTWLLQQSLVQLSGTEWKVEVFQFCPSMLGIPVRRPRRYTVAWNPSRVNFSGNCEEFLQLFGAQPKTTGGIYFQAGMQENASMTHREAWVQYHEKIELNRAKGKGERYHIVDLNQRPPFGSISSL